MQDSKSGSSARGTAEPKPSPYLTRDQIERSPSRAFFLKKANGDVELAREKERTARTTTCAFMQESGIKLLLPQLSIATAIVFFHRFYARMSYETYDRVTVATTCLFLASKVEESPKKLKDVVIETYKAHHKVDKAPDVESKEFFDLKERVLVCERILLQVLGFDLSVEHAYRPLLAYVKSIKGSKDLAQIAWNFINDSLRTTICLQYPPRCLAAAGVHLASKYLATHVTKDFKLPDNPQHGGKWFLSFETTEETIQDISEQILELYMSGNQPVVGPNGGPGILSAASLSLVRLRHCGPRLSEWCHTHTARPCWWRPRGSLEISGCALAQRPPCASTHLLV